MKNKDYIIGIVGLGYVGLPLAISFGSKYKTLGFDVSKSKVINYVNANDPTGELSKSDFKKSKYLNFYNDSKILSKANIIIVAVPTPIDSANVPDLRPLKKACILIGKRLKRGSIVIFEPTVFPGATEEICIPILEKYSKLKWKIDFNVAYSPERINPGDKEKQLSKIIKVISADNNDTLNKVEFLYKSIIKAGLFKASSIKVAEAAKVIENTQRDVNIALMNEFAMIFNHLNIDTKEVLDAASSKWNFIKFQPGLVGGHCIGVDPYYLTYKAQSEGYIPRLILSGRKINDGMANYLSQLIIKKMVKLNLNSKNSKVLILGLTFKENCSDLRNSKVFDLINDLNEFGFTVESHDPFVTKQDIIKYQFKVTDWKNLDKYDVIIGAVSHKFYLKKSITNILKFLKKDGIFFDIKSSYPKDEIIGLGYNYWRL